MCGENLEPGVPKFRSLADEPVDLATGGYYFAGIFGERVLSPWVNLAGVAMLLVIFALTLI